MVASLTLSQAGGEQVQLTGIGLAAPVGVVVAGQPASCGLAGRPGQGRLVDSTLSFTAPWVPVGTASGNTVLTGSDGTIVSIPTTFVASFHGSMTFALRTLFDATWYMGPRSIAQVPALYSADPAALTVPGPPGAFEWLTAAIGSVFSRYGGLRLSRLAVAALPGDGQLVLERASGLPLAGAVRLDGIVYNYTGIAGQTLTGIYATAGGTPAAGVQAAHIAGAQVADASGVSSYLDQVRNSYFVQTASGSDLAQLGRDAGVPQSPAVGSDAQLRAIIKALAFSPRGTIYGLTTALDALLGAGTYTLSEDPFGAPCAVVVNVPYNQTSAMTSSGHAYMTAVSQQLPSSGSFLLPSYAVGAGRLRLRSENSDFSCRAVSLLAAPDSDGSPLFKLVSGALTTISVGADNSQATQLVGCTAQVGCTRTVRTLPDTSGSLSAYVRILAGEALNASNGLGCAFLLQQSVTYVAGLTATSGGALLALRNATSGAALGTAAFVGNGVWCHVSLDYTPAGVRLSLNGQVIAFQASPSVAGNSSAGQVLIGQVGASTVAHQGAGCTLQIRDVSLYCSTPTDFGCGTGGLTRLDSTHCSYTSYVLGPESVGRQVWIQNSSVTNPQGGTNNGAYTVLDQSLNAVNLGGPTFAGCQLTVANGTAVVSLPASGNSLWWPQDLGKRLVIASSKLGNAGTYVIGDMFDALTGAALSTMQTKLPQRSRTVLLTQAPSASEAGLSVRLLPTFVVDSAMTLLTDSGTLVTTSSTQVRVAPRSLPRADVAYDVPYGSVPSASLMASAASRVTVQAGSPPVPSQYGFYLSSPFSILDGYSTDLTAAGIRLILNTA